MKTRKDFLVASSLTPAAALFVPSIASVKGSALIAAAGDEIPPLRFNHARFTQLISRAAAHRHMFAAASIARGTILAEMYNTFYAYENSLGVSPSRILAAGVLYHGMSVTLALSDTAWNQMLLPVLQQLPAEIRADLQSVQLGSGNPLLHKGPSGLAAQSFEALVSSGAVFFVCNSAIAGLAVLLGQALARTSGDVYTQLIGSLVRGATLVPTGVWAIHALQEAHFTYLQTSL